jgi:hypothetical protein
MPEDVCFCSLFVPLYHTLTTMKQLLAICLLLTCSTALAQEIKASIKGPSTALAGTLVFLSHEEAVGDNKVWIIPEELKSASASCGNNIFFSIPTPGKYQFGLIVANKQADIAYSWHTIDVTGMLAPTPAPVPTPIQPSPAFPPPSYESIRLTSRTAVETLQDASTTSLLASSLINLLPKLPAYLPDAKGQVTSTIETCFAMREPTSRTKDWLNVWRVPIDKEIGKANPTTTDEYRECLKAVIRGLCVNGKCPNP